MSGNIIDKAIFLMPDDADGFDMSCGDDDELIFVPLDDHRKVEAENARLKKERDDYREHATTVDEDIESLRDKYAKLQSVVDGRIAVAHLMNNDSHKFSTRPCGTCQAITVLVGEPFGCNKAAEQAKEQHHE